MKKLDLTLAEKLILGDTFKGERYDEILKALRYYDAVKTVRIHVRGGVAYPPERMPRTVRVVIIDHDENT